MKHFLVSLFSLLLSLHASAALLTNDGSKGKLEGVALSSGSTASVEGESIKLSHIGAGLRAKKVVFVNVKVYVGELFASSPEKFKKSETEALGSLKDQKVIAIQLHFLRNVDADNVQKSFKEALKANNINLDDSNVKQFLDSVAQGGEAKEGKTLTILGAKLKDGSEEVIYETTSGNTSSIKGNAGFVEKVFSIWLGKSADDGVAHLKASILKN
ncbi:chalcone isomerase family protein [Bdellovibrio svalbardensis]|uniref:Chalcone isomerase family protein n=1 Tax=Bdellovibrio svalbardensis TaxID=2972972 RepID=A0ABT6DN38_9BACT|nr:chalcone isomerase family protein [Bdellovibrio svalbardensis]MDG0818287.1 chalcone isomerase family protein [Bdellovibrio svalbardensis]